MADLITSFTIGSVDNPLRALKDSLGSIQEELSFHPCKVIELEDAYTTPPESIYLNLHTEDGEEYNLPLETLNLETHENP